MKNFFMVSFKWMIVLLACIVSTRMLAQEIIPRPVKVVAAAGSCDLTKTVSVSYNSPQLESLSGYLVEQVSKWAGIKVVKRKGAGKPDGVHIKLLLEKTGDKAQEGYTLSVTPYVITIRAPRPQGVFYGVQSLLQLIPADKPAVLTAVTIVDKPRFGWRGLMLDVSRHFFTVSDVKRMIDEMAAYKFNMLHLHLTDDQGWRMEIKSLPELTNVGAWSVPRTGLWWERKPPQPGEKATYGGFYTQEQLKELIRYAASRYIQVLPEIDVPGHSLAAIAAYPQLSCTKQIYKVNPGSKFYGEEDNALCPGQEKTFEFMEKVLTEVAEVFPFPYVHIGGDECFRGFWQKCDACLERMKTEHLKDDRELQSYFIKRMEEILKRKGRKLLGWDEILEGGLPPEATVMSWRGMDGGIEAAKAGHQVVMSPTMHAYLDLYQGDPAVEPPTYSSLRLKNVYAFEPVPKGIDSSLVLGGQGNLWAESVPNWRHAEYMLWPRALALAEVLWTPASLKNWNGFTSRVAVHLKRLEKTDISYAPSMYEAIITPSKDTAGNIQIRLDTEVEGIDLYYSFDNTLPDHHGPHYKKGETLSVPEDADTFRVISYSDGKPIGRLITIPLTTLEARIPK